METTKELYQSPAKERNNENFGEYGCECICCGKPMAKGICYFVQMNEAWKAVSPEINECDFKEVTGSESQGAFPIGNECAKKMKGFIFKAELNESHPKYK